MHPTILSTEVLETSVGTGMSYLLDTTNYEEVNGQVGSYQSQFTTTRFHSRRTTSYLVVRSGCYSARTMRTRRYSPRPATSDTSHGGTWDGRIYLSVPRWAVDRRHREPDEGGLEGRHRNRGVLRRHCWLPLPHGADGQPLESAFYDFGWTPFLWAAEYHEGYTYLSCITSGLYIVQLDIDAPYATR